MSKQSSNNKNKHHVNGSDSVKGELQNNESTTVCIGAANVKLWNELKATCKYNCDVKFTSFLLNLAQKHSAKRNNDDKRKHNNSGESLDIKDESSHRKTKQTEHSSIHKHSHSTKRSHNRTSHRKRSHGTSEEHKSSKSCDKKEEKNKNKRKSDELDKINECVDDKLVINETSDKDSSKQIIDFPLPMVVVENLNFSLENLGKTNISLNGNAVFPTEKLQEPYLIKEETANNIALSETLPNEIPENNLENIEDTTDNNEIVVQPEKSKTKHRKKHKHDNSHETKHKSALQTNEPEKKEKDKTKRKVKHHDIRKAPQLDLNAGIKPEIKNEIPAPIPESQPELLPEPVLEEVKSEHQRVAIKIKLCNTCNTRHLQDTCPIKHPNNTIEDSITLDTWNKNPDNIKTNSDSNENIDKSDDSTSEEKVESFAENSLPSILYLEQSENSHGLSVFAKQDIKEYTQFGPLIGEIIKEVDIAEDSSMRHIWEVYVDKKNMYFNTENRSTSNWIRYIRPAPTRDVKNLLAISESRQIYMITTRDIASGEELLFWQDDATGSNKKKMEKTNCGGCNLTFTHPLYYRVHCSIFHDIRYSLTIRKYHCKVCGAAVLGKDNIMKHAVELHNGQGAYQCQFCKKFFLRLNYLEMHRTYGCAANPHRSRPLCDFCGRKFCQPQKLKVHIKRMHSDMSEVLREFQCKSCLKLLGSRAALQRHVKEVHQKQMDGSCTCVRCGKLFQNKSNLKIHMLTHSGVKPFKCKEQNCSAAFTTKQCLQFHYKKVHGFAEDIMPKIERSVEYTFAAYAGVKNAESNNGDKNKKKNQQQTQISDNLMCLDDSTDVDDISLDDKNLDDPPDLHSPIPITSEHSSRSNQTPPMLEAYSNNIRTNNTKVQSKGSKKWLGEDSSHSLNLSLQQPQKEVYQFEKEIHKPAEPPTNIMLEVDESQSYDRNKISMSLNVYNRHESSNASLLVEAALDSVSDIQITNSEHNVDVNGSQSCTDSLVNNLYSLSHQDNLPDVTYNHSEDLNESRDINLISPSVNDHISVTDHDLNDDLPNRGITLDYSNLHHSEFSPSSSPNVQSRSQQLIHDYNIHAANSPAHTPRSRLDYTLGHDSEIVSPGNSPPRYDFHHTPAENLSSDESNGIVAQNLSLNNSKDKLRLDLVGYKSHYGELDSSDLSLRKYDSLRQKYDLENERNKMYDLEVDDRNKSYNERGLTNDIRSKFDISNTTETIETDLRNKYSESTDHSSELKMKQFEVETDFRSKYHEEENMHSNKYDSIESKYEGDVRNKQIEMDVELRSKTYDSLETERNKTTYESSLETEIRNKSYDVIDNLELRSKTYDNIVDTEFRTDRNFEPLVLNPTELQGLDMSARSYHNFHTTGTVQGINRYHHIYSELDRPSVDLRLGYSPPPPPYSHTDVLRVVSLDLTPPGRHSVDLSLRSHALHSHQLPNSRLLTDHPLQTNRLISTEHNLSANRILSEHNRLTLDQTRLLTNEHNLSVASNRLLGTETRLLPDTSNRLLSDHTTNRLLSNDQLGSNRLLSEQGRMLTDDSRLLTDQTRLLDQSRLLGDTRILQPTPSSTTNHDLVTRSSLSPAGYTGYPVSPSPYHASSLAARTHGNSPGHTAATSYHHYSTYY